MILQALYEYYQRKAADPQSKIASEGLEWKEIPFIIVIDENGKFINLEDTRSIVGKNKRANSFLVIKTKGRSGPNSYKTSNAFWDHYGFVLAYPKDEREKSKSDANKQHKSFSLLVNQFVEKYPNNIQFNAVKEFLNNPEQIQMVFAHEYWKDCSKIPGCNLSFRFVGERSIVAENKDLDVLEGTEKPLIDQEGNAGDIAITQGICLITGEYSPIAVLHTATSLPGGKSGGKLVGFQRNSGYDSYYKQQGLNAPVSRKAEAAYTTALNVLLRNNSNNKFRLSDASIVFWAEKTSDFESKFPFFFAAPPKDDPDRNIREVKALFDSVYSGKANNEGDTSFYILGLAPNAARISVRLWKTGKIRDFTNKIVLHYNDLEIVRGKNDDREYYSLYNLLSNIAFENKLDNIPPNLSVKVIESVLDGTVYPVTLQQQCLRRIRADVGEKTHVTRIRAAILKSYLNRKNRFFNTNEKQITMALDTENSNQAYLCGRLFAILEKIQEEAQGTANIRDRFYGAACSTPVTVFGRLLSLSNHHLAKLHPGRKTNFEKLIQEVMANIISNGMPAHLSLDDQSRFAIGYYHQRQDLFTKKENNN